MTLPSISPQKNFTCFSCGQDGVRPFSKIFRGHMIYHICKSNCLSIALKNLGLLNEDERTFMSPVNITIQSPTSAFVNTSSSPIQRSLASPNLSSFGISEAGDVDLRQLQELGKSIKKQTENKND